MLLAITLIAIATLALIAALALGWNSPRPGLPPDWEAPALPRRVEVAPDAPALTLLGRPSNDFTFEVLALPLSGPDCGFYDYGLVYRVQDATHYYAFVVGADGYYAVVRVDGKTLTPLLTWQQFPHIRRGQQSNRLLVTCAGPSCVFRINDEYAATVDDDTWLSGDVGLWARSFTGEAVVEFRYACLWAPDS